MTHITFLFDITALEDALQVTSCVNMRDLHNHSKSQFSQL